MYWSFLTNSKWQVIGYLSFTFLLQTNRNEVKQLYKCLIFSIILTWAVYDVKCVRGDLTQDSFKQLIGVKFRLNCPIMGSENSWSDPCWISVPFRSWPSCEGQFQFCTEKQKRKGCYKATELSSIDADAASLPKLFFQNCRVEKHWKT